MSAVAALGLLVGPGLPPTALAQLPSCAGLVEGLLRKMADRVNAQAK